MPSRILTLSLLLSLQSFPALSAESGLSQDYLAGRWSVEGKAGCESSTGQYVVFRQNGTVEAGRGEVPGIVGFWELLSDGIAAHTLRTPVERVEDWHPFLRDSYRYEYMKPEVVRVESDVLELDIGNDLQRERVTLTRCH